MSSTRQEGKNHLEIIITQNTETIMLYSSPIFASAVGLTLAIILGGLIVFFPILILCILLFTFIYWISKVAPVDKPDIYQINSETNILRYKEHSIGKWQDGNLSTVDYVKFINHKYRKKLNIQFYKDNKKYIGNFGAPFFEKCHDEWQRLFDEIRKRIPEDAEVIVK